MLITSGMMTGLVIGGCIGLVIALLYPLRARQIPGFADGGKYTYFVSGNRTSKTKQTVQMAEEGRCQFMKLTHNFQRHRPIRLTTPNRTAHSQSVCMCCFFRLFVLLSGCSCWTNNNSPFFGSIFYIWKHFDRFHDMIHDLSKQIGEGNCWTSGIAGNPPYVYVGADPTIMQHVLKDSFWKYEKGIWFRSTVEVLLGEGIFNSDGDKWQQQRKVASHMFTARSLKEDMSKIFLKNAKIVVEKLSFNAKEKKIFDIQDLFFRYTLDSFSEVAFGESAGCLSDVSRVPFADAFDKVQSLTNERFFVPTFLWKIKRLLKLGGERVIAKNMKIIKDYGYSVIERTKRHRAEEKGGRTDLLSMFIEYAEEHNQPIHNHEMLDVVLNFIIAGRDTTACLLSWATYELTQHPELQERLYREALGFQVDDEATRAVQELPLLHAFIMETLRLHPPVPQDAKECIADDIWPTGQSVPKGTMVVYSPYLMGRSQKLWGKDAETFNIQRWFDKDGQPIKEPSQYMFPVFNAGLRLCLGKSVAILESTMLLSIIIQQFRFTCMDHDVTYALSVTMPIKSGLRVKVDKRT